MIDRGFSLAERLSHYFPKFLLDLKIQNIRFHEENEVSQLIIASNLLLHDFLICLSPEPPKRIDALGRGIS